MATKKVLPIRCEGTLLPLSELQPFQGTLKILYEKQYQKLRQSLETYGIRFPIFYWEHKGVKYTLDGHQRIFVLQKMIEDGWELKGGKVPTVGVEAKTEQEAKQLILIAASQYAYITPEGLYEFLKTEGLDFGDIRGTLELPSLNLDAFAFGWMSEAQPANSVDEHYIGLPQYDNENQKWYKTLIVHFENQDEVDEFSKMIGQLITPHTKSVNFRLRERKDLTEEGWVAGGQQA
jgi:hypothetical protein